MLYNSITIFRLWIFLGPSIFFAQNYSLSLIGTDSTETKIIDSIGYQKNFADLDLLFSQLDVTQLKLERLGYINTEIMSYDKVTDTTYSARLDLGRRYKKLKIFFNNIKDPKTIKSLLNVEGQAYFELSPAEVETTLDLLTAKISETGDPFVKVSLVDLKSSESDTLVAELKIETTRYREIDKLVFKGYDKFPKSYAKHFLRIKTQQPFNLSKIKKRFSRIDNLSFVRGRKEPEVLFTQDSTLLYIYLEKRNANNFDGFLGFGTNEQSGKIQFNGLVNLKLINNLNYGESLSLYYRSDENEQRTFNINLELPYLLGMPIGTNASLKIFKQDSTFLTTNQSASIQYQLNARNKILMGIDFIKSDPLGAVSPSGILNYNTILYRVQFKRLDIGDTDPLYPFNNQIDAHISTGNRKITGIKSNQTIFSLDAQKVFHLDQRNALFGRLEGRYLQSDDVLINELFRFGGINSIRGFQENSIMADSYGVIGTEYRYKLSPSLYVHSILDAAYYQNQLNDIEENLFGFGFGFGILTEAGLLKFNYAGQKIENQSIRLSEFKIHLSLTAQF